MKKKIGKETEGNIQSKICYEYKKENEHSIYAYEEQKK